MAQYVKSSGKLLMLRIKILYCLGGWGGGRVMALLRIWICSDPPQLDRFRDAEL
jgi:hypothetical protein